MPPPFMVVHGGALVCLHEQCRFGGFQSVEPKINTGAQFLLPAQVTDKAIGLPRQPGHKVGIKMLGIGS